MGIINWGNTRTKPKSFHADYFLEGDYFIRLDSVKEFADEQGVPGFSVQGTVIVSNNDKLQPGTKAKKTLMAGGNKSFKEDVTKAVCDLLDAEEVTSEQYEALVGEDQPLVGEYFKVTARNNKKGTWTYVRYAPAPDAMLPDLTAKAKALGL